MKVQNKNLFWKSISSLDKKKLECHCRNRRNISKEFISAVKLGMMKETMFVRSADLLIHRLLLISVAFSIFAHPIDGSSGQHFIFDYLFPLPITLKVVTK
jgi:hypothetical protein